MLSLDKWRARSRALRPVVGACCRHEKHRTLGGLKESKMQREGHGSFCSLTVLSEAIVRILHEVL